MMDGAMAPRAQNLIGTIAEVNGPVVDVACERLPPLHRAVRSHANRC